MYSEYAIVALVVSRGCSLASAVLTSFAAGFPPGFRNPFFQAWPKHSIFFLAVVQQLAIFELHKYGKEAA